MGKFSSKSDFYDHLFMSAKSEEEGFEKFNGTKLYITQPLPNNFDFKKELEEGVNIPETYYKKVEYSSLKDLIPYYPYIITMGYHDNEDPSKSIVCLSSESYIDKSEKEFLELRLRCLIRAYNRCKRKNVEFNIEEEVNKIWFHPDWERDVIIEIANRVKEKGENATIDGLHIWLYEHYRKELVHEMFKHGLDPKDYGYGRFVGGEI